MKTLDFKPKIVSAIKNYNKQTFMADLMAGLIVGIVALPLAIAFGIASGVSPEKGIITAIVAGLFISLFGGSKVQIGGPTGAFIIIVYTAPGHHHQVHSLPHCRRFHQRYRRHHLHHTGQRLAGHADGRCSL